MAPGRLHQAIHFSEKGIPKDSEAGRKHFGLLMERRRAEESGADYEQIRRDWVLGSEAFGQELLAAAGRASRSQPPRLAAAGNRPPDGKRLATSDQCLQLSDTCRFV
jgi:hypothetical protein